MVLFSSSKIQEHEKQQWNMSIRDERPIVSHTQGDFCWVNETLGDFHSVRKRVVKLFYKSACFLTCLLVPDVVRRVEERSMADKQRYAVRSISLLIAVSHSRTWRRTGTSVGPTRFGLIFHLFPLFSLNLSFCTIYTFIYVYVYASARFSPALYHSFSDSQRSQ